MNAVSPTRHTMRFTHPVESRSLECGFEGEVTVTRASNGREELVFLTGAGDAPIVLTPAEAEDLATALLRVAAEARR